MPRAGSAKKTLLLAIALLLLLAVFGAAVSFTPFGDRLRTLLAERGGGKTDGDVIATLASIENGVKHRDRSALDWNDARREMPLSDGDKIRTLDDSTAQVKFTEGSELLVEEKSLITIRAPRKDDDTLVADVEIDDGRVRTSIARTAAGKDRKLQIKSGGRTLAEITTEGSAGFADVSVVVRPDRSSRIVMHRGSGKIVSMGKTITLDEGKVVVADVATSTLGTPETVRPLDPPSPSFPAPGARISAAVAGTSGAATVRLGWKPSDGAAAYTVQVAKDSAFTNVASSAETTTTEYAFAATEPGEYHWRVITVDSNLLPGAPSPARSFKIAFATPKPSPTPRIVAKTPRPTPKKSPTPLPIVKKYELEGTVGEPLVVVGSVKKDVLKVSVNGVEAKIDKAGNFRATLSNLPAGKRTIVVESIHSDGSITYDKREAFIKPP